MPSGFSCGKAICFPDDDFGSLRVAANGGEIGFDATPNTFLILAAIFLNTRMLSFIQIYFLLQYTKKERGMIASKNGNHSIESVQQLEDSSKALFSNHLSIPLKAHCSIHRRFHPSCIAISTAYRK